MENPKIVVLVEPSFYGVGFIKATYNKGCRVVAIVSSEENPIKYGYQDFYHDLIIADVRDEESVLNAITSSEYYGEIEALIPATDYVSYVTAKVGEKLGLRGISADAALKARNKDMARIAYEKHRVPSAKFKIVKGYDEAVNATNQIGFPVVLKPTNCASSQNVFFINNLAELNKSMEEMMKFKTTYMGFPVRNEYLIEEYLEGPEFSVELFLKDEQAIFSIVTEKLTTALPYFVEISHTLPTSSYRENQTDIINVAIRAVLALGINNGPSHVEIKLTKEGPKIIEVNGRPGGDNISTDLLEASFGINIFEATVDYYLGNDVSITPTKDNASSIAYLTATKNGVISDIKGLEAIKDNEKVIKYVFSIKPGDTVSIAKSSDDRLGYIITAASTPSEAKQEALNLIENIKVVYG
jgi:S-sulfo-L-cysteine synthase (3-phospho-L-serine-dependent)